MCHVLCGVGPSYGIGGHIKLHVRLKVSCNIFHCTMFYVIPFSLVSYPINIVRNFAYMACDYWV